MDLLGAIEANFLTPIVLSFVMGMAAGLAKSDLSIPEAIAKGMAIYLMFAIGLKGGVSFAEAGLSVDAVLAAVAGMALSFALPFLAFALLRGFARVDRINAAAVAAHYGSISIVTFIAASELLKGLGYTYEGYLVAVVALMETPAIISGLILASRGRAASGAASVDKELLREVLLNGSVVLLIGAFLIGWMTGGAGLEEVSGFFVDPFKGVLCLFLLDMGLVAARRLREVNVLSLRLVVFGLAMPCIGAALGAVLGYLLGLSVGGATVFAVLAASASYIAVPAAMRLALPEANTALYITLSLAVTFPFNVTLGIPLYLAGAEALYGGVG